MVHWSLPSLFLWSKQAWSHLLASTYHSLDTGRMTQRRDPKSRGWNQELREIIPENKREVWTQSIPWLRWKKSGTPPAWIAVIPFLLLWKSEHCSFLTLSLSAVVKRGHMDYSLPWSLSLWGSAHNESQPCCFMILDFRLISHSTRFA